jgi:hypothetical protein
VLVSAPVFSTVLPPLFDYPNHLARMHLLAEGGNRFFQVRWAPLPDLAEDLIVPPLSRLLPLETAGKLFLVMIFAAIAGGVLWLNRTATGAWRIWPLSAFLLLYNRSFLWGFLNYLFGLGAALLGAALWLALEDRRPALRVAASSAAALVCFFSHLAAFGVYAVTIGGIELPHFVAALRARDRSAVVHQAVVVGAQFIVPVGVLVHWRRATVGGGTAYAGFLRKFDLPFGVFDNYARAFDIAGFALCSGLLVWLAATGRLGLTRRLGLGAALLLLCYLALPSRLFGASGIDHRLPLAIFLLVIAGSAPRFPDRRVAVVIGAAAAVLLALRIGVIERVWLQADRIYSADLAGLDRLPPETRLAVAYPAGSIHVSAVPDVHLPAMAVVRRDAFVSTLFALPGQQPLALRQPWAAIAAAAQPALLWTALAGPAALPLPAVLAHFDAVALVGDRAAAPNRCLRAILATPSLRILSVQRGIGCFASDPGRSVFSLARLEFERPGGAAAQEHAVPGK